MMCAAVGACHSSPCVPVCLKLISPQFSCQSELKQSGGAKAIKRRGCRNWCLLAFRRQWSSSLSHDELDTSGVRSVILRVVENKRLEQHYITVKDENRGRSGQAERRLQDGNAGIAGHSSVTARRQLLFSLSVALGALMLGNVDLPAKAAVSTRVKLKDVENPKLQDALRAAVAGDLETAEELFSALIDEDSANASVWSNRGSVRVSLLKFEEAAQDFSKAIELAPEAPVPFLNRAISYEALGRYQEAIADCKTAIVNDPEEFAAWFNLGNVEARVRDYDTALTAYSRASVLAPGIAGYRLKQALVLFQLDRLGEAKKLIQGLVRKYPNYTEAHAALAAVLWKEGDRSRAEEQFSEATSREPQYSNIRWIGAELQWPPGAVEAMAKFLNITY